MDKHELVSLTLDKLIDNFQLSPESFEYVDNIAPTIVWRPKIELNNSPSSMLIHDPNNAHAIVVMFNTHSNEVVCYIFLNAPADPLINTGKADCIIGSQRWLEKYRGNYRKLMKLKKLIATRNSQKANLAYVRKLSYIFPDAVDKHLL